MARETDKGRLRLWQVKNKEIALIRDVCICRMMKECREYSNVTPVAPPLPIPYGTHHTKMLVALYPEKVRVAIFTANFLSNDWSTKTQAVWFQDFGLKFLVDSDDEEEEKSAGACDVVNNFEGDLVHYLSSLGAPVKLFCGELKWFDFSTARVALVPSVPGVHKGTGMGFMFVGGEC
ncbi:unnamed protein product [Phytophthora lilii]|uniref:Unnamed protein product n=1 Tax=Phytophthora lilii TaxID=2077276 RepID=A0A9W6YI88_9STRA|nr:unnamed protein product [Phytophthora lilii]